MRADPPGPDRPGRRELRQFLSERNQYPDRVARIDEQLRATFGRTVAVLALDMCGFTSLSSFAGGSCAGFCGWWLPRSNLSARCLSYGVAAPLGAPGLAVSFTYS